VCLGYWVFDVVSSAPLVFFFFFLVK